MFLHVQRLTVCIYILYHFRDIFRTSSYPPRDPATWPHTHTHERQIFAWGKKFLGGLEHSLEQQLLTVGCSFLAASELQRLRWTDSWTAFFRTMTIMTDHFRGTVSIWMVQDLFATVASLRAALLQVGHPSNLTEVSNIGLLTLRSCDRPATKPTIFRDSTQHSQSFLQLRSMKHKLLVYI